MAKTTDATPSTAKLPPIRTAPSIAESSRGSAPSVTNPPPHPQTQAKNVSAREVAISDKLATIRLINDVDLRQDNQLEWLQVRVSNRDFILKQ